MRRDEPGFSRYGLDVAGGGSRKAVARGLSRVCSGLSALAEKYAATPAIGRTLLQDALPVGFGLRLAQAMAGIDSAMQRLHAEVAKNAKIQFGGAAGTRAGLGGKGTAVARRMAEALGLAADMPWHARREGVATIAAALGIVIGALGKLARDISLLAQNAIGEVLEPAIAGRGCSSAMAHKRNPTGCQVALSAALRAPGLVATMLSSLPAEEERGLGGWQAEGPVLAELFLLAAGSAEAMAVVAEGLDVDEAAISRNLHAAAIGDDIGESTAIVSELLAQLPEGLNMPFTTRDNTRLYWRLEGAENRPALLLLNSIGTDMSLWDAVLPFLKTVLPVAAHGYARPWRVRRTGRRLQPANAGGGCGAVMDAAGIAQTAVAGVSLGGMVAMQMALDYPEKISSLALICAWRRWIKPRGRAGSTPCAARARLPSPKWRSGVSCRLPTPRSIRTLPMA